MLRRMHMYQRIVVPFSLTLLLLLISAPAVFASSHRYIGPRELSLVGPKKYYLALGDSLAFGYQLDLDFNHGYADDFFANLQGHGAKALANMGCPGETSNTFINGGCPYPFLRKFPYIGSQLQAALTFLHLFKGQVSPVTLDIGANDLLPNINTSNCQVNQARFNSGLAALDSNLTRIILPELHAALVVNGQLTGDLIMMNYYDPFQNICPNSVPYVQLVNQHLANDVNGYGSIAGVFTAFGGASVPNSHICAYTWMCSIFKDIHCTSKGYSVIAAAFEKRTGY